MKVSMELVYQHIRRKFPEAAEGLELVTAGGETGIRRAVLMSQEPEYTDDSFLWFGDGACLPDRDGTQETPGNYLLYGDREIMERLRDTGQYNAILIPGTLEPVRVFNFVSWLLHEIEKWQHEMDLAIVYGRGIQAMLDAGRNLIRDLIIVWNPSFELVAHTSWIPLEREPVNEIVRCGKFPGSAVRRIIQMGYLDNPRRFDHLTVTYPPNWVDTPFVLRVFSYRGCNAFTMAQYFPEEEPTSADLEMLHILEHYMEQYVRSSPAMKQEPGKRLYEPFLIELLYGKLAEEHEIRDRLEYIHMPYEADYLLMDIRIANFTTPLVAYVMRNCKMLFPFSKRLAHKERIFVVLNLSWRKHGSGTIEEKLEQVAGLLETVKGVCAISRPFRTLAGLGCARQETEAALEVIGKRRIVYFQEVQFSILVRNFQEYSQIPLVHLISPELLAVYQEDLEKGNDNIRLLDFYLGHNCNITDTAREMNLHRNSVIYRLGRLEEKLHLQLEDAQARFRLQVMLRLFAFPAVKEMLEEGKA
ncbi:MAG: PucR family transcriptional regulator [Lachnospiraceae bacterium]|nr:PucR family transcriptional regulator [Lachnospiraceae bacterium]